jgi:hypothetical protein
LSSWPPRLPASSPAPTSALTAAGPRSSAECGVPNAEWLVVCSLC